MAKPKRKVVQFPLRGSYSDNPTADFILAADLQAMIAFMEPCELKRSVEAIIATQVNGVCRVTLEEVLGFWDQGLTLSWNVPDSSLLPSSGRT